jgi:hypothetical protein
MDENSKALPTLASELAAKAAPILKEKGVAVELPSPSHDRFMEQSDRRERTETLSEQIRIVRSVRAGKKRRTRVPTPRAERRGPVKTFTLTERQRLTKQYRIFQTLERLGAGKRSIAEVAWHFNHMFKPETTTKQQIWSFVSFWKNIPQLKLERGSVTVLEPVTATLLYKEYTEARAANKPAKKAAVRFVGDTKVISGKTTVGTTEKPSVAGLEESLTKALENVLPKVLNLVLKVKIEIVGISFAKEE